MTRLALRTVIASIVLALSIVVAGCTPGGGGGASQPAAPASAQPGSAAPVDDGY